jgi:hypothetical protein
MIHTSLFKIHTSYFILHTSAHRLLKGKPSQGRTFGLYQFPTRSDLRALSRSDLRYSQKGPTLRVLVTSLVMVLFVCFFLLVPSVHAADTTIRDDLQDQDGKANRYMVSTAPGVRYAFFVIGGADLYYSKFSGGSWATAVPINTNFVRQFDIWYDQWTPGDTGKVIHIAYNDSTPDDTLYRGLDTSDDSLSTETTINDGTSYDTNGTDYAAGSVSIVKSIGGNLYSWAEGDAGIDAGDRGFFRSVDGGANWTSRNFDAYESNSDFALLMPGNETDTDDIYALYYDNSAGELSVKHYDNSANTWPTETSITTAVQIGPPTDLFPYDAAIRHSDKHIIVVVPSEEDSATGDLLTFEITNIGTNGALTTIFSNVDDWYIPSVFINQQNSDIYVAYAGQDDGAQDWRTTVDVHYVLSTDSGTSWGSETTYSEDVADDIRQISTGHSVNNAGGDFSPVFFNDDLKDIFENQNNSVAISTAVCILIQGNINITGGNINITN